MNARSSMVVAAVAAILAGTPLEEMPAQLGLTSGQTLSLCADYGLGEPVCDQYLLAPDDVPDPVGQCLFDWGWRGLPGDGRESLYVPARVIERAVQECATRST